MKNRASLSWNRPAGVLMIVMALVVAGCGGDTASPPADQGETPVKVTEPPVAASKKAPRAGRGQPLSPGGDMGVRERRSEKLKERAAAGKS